MKLALKRGEAVPLYRQVGEQIRALIEHGSLQPGARLPTVRQLALDHGLTRLTVQNAYAELQEQGWVESTVGRGSFVAQRPQIEHTVGRAPLELTSSLAELLHPDVTDQLGLAQAAPSPDTYPLKELKASLWTALQQPESLAYGPIQGDECLRVQISRLFVDRGLSVSPEEVLITAGAQQAIDLAIRALGDHRPVALEVPVYPGVLESLRARGQQVIEVPIDAEGISLRALDEACRRHKPRLLYTVPAFHNPTGLLMTPERRRGLMELAERHNLLILEDDVYGFLSFENSYPPPLKADDPSERVVYLTSFSKTVTPGWRLGAVVASQKHLTALCQLKQATDLICSSLLQRAMAEFLRKGCFESHIRRVTQTYRERRDALVEALRPSTMSDCLWTVPAGGLSAWLSLPLGVDEAEFCREAKDRGVVLARGQAFFSSPQPQGHVRLSFAAQKPRGLQQAVRVMEELLGQHQRRISSLQQRVRLRAGPLV